MVDSPTNDAVADAKLVPEEITSRINNLIRGFERAETPKEKGCLGGLAELRELVAETARASGVDFSNYKEETLNRRILSRMKALAITDIAQYVDGARQSGAELNVLKRLFVVTLSWFFRDRDAFAALKPLLSGYLATNPVDKKVRIWVPGCATGEEAYSIAMLVLEAASGRNLRSRIEVIGSDLNDQAIEVARHGVYSEKSFKEFNSPSLITKYFSREGDQYRVCDELRAACQFRHEDVIVAESPQDIDLVSCRNLLIYLNTKLQSAVLTKCFRALKANGLLFLGMDESVERSGSVQFLPVDYRFRIFQRNSTQTVAHP